jgi:hypothetical protein
MRAIIRNHSLPFGGRTSGGGGTIPPPTAIPFKCSAATGKCKCYDTGDCDWMKSLVFACTVPSGCRQNCECTIAKSTKTGK